MSNCCSLKASFSFSSMRTVAVGGRSDLQFSQATRFSETTESSKFILKEHPVNVRATKIRREDNRVLKRVEFATSPRPIFNPLYSLSICLRSRNTFSRPSNLFVNQTPSPTSLTKLEGHRERIQFTFHQIQHQPSYYTRSKRLATKSLNTSANINGVAPKCTHGNIIWRSNLPRRTRITVSETPVM